MINILLMTDSPGAYTQTGEKLYQRGINLSFPGKDKSLVDEASYPGIDILAVEINNQQELASDSSLWENLRLLREQRKLPVLLVLPLTLIESLASRPEINDFILKPVDPLEMEIRIRRCLKPLITGSEIIKSGDMVIDLAQAEVYIGGKTVELTFKEFELLKFLASNKNRVYKRETLLNELWGYDYFGGDRTVDVHIRRLRSKIEDSDHTFIETVRNMGYKFKSQG